jgi:hypothetical protein
MTSRRNRHRQAVWERIRLQRPVIVQPDVAPLLRFWFLERLSAAVLENSVGAVFENNLVLGVGKWRQFNGKMVSVQRENDDAPARNDERNTVR